MTGAGPAEELELADYLSILRRRWRWFALPLLLGPALAYGFTTIRVDVYEAHANVLLGDTAAQEAVGATNQNSSMRTRLLQNEVRLALGDDARTIVAERLDTDVEDLEEPEVTPVDGSDVLTFEARSPSPDHAAATAAAWAETYVELKRAQNQASITEAIDSLGTRLAELQSERDELRADLLGLEDRIVSATAEQQARLELLIAREESSISGPVALIDAQIDAVISSINDLELRGELADAGSARVVVAASIPDEPASRPASQMIVLGAVVGAIAGAALALLRENLDRAVRGHEDVEVLGVPLLGTIPRSRRLKPGRELGVLVDAEGPEAEAMQKLQTSITFLAAAGEIRTIAITSARQGEGKTTTATGLALASARSGRRTLFLDADLRRPRVHKVFDVPQAPGLTNAALGLADTLDAAHPQIGITDALVVMPAGSLPPHPVGFLSSDDFATAIGELGALADLTIVDAAPVLPVADTLSLASRVDGTIVVAHAGQTAKTELADTIESIAMAGGRVLGCVLIGATSDRGRYEYRYEADDAKLDRLGPLDLLRDVDHERVADDAVPAEREAVPERERVRVR